MSAPLDLGSSYPANDTTAHWSAQITTAWRETIDGIFHVGDLLTAAKADPGCRFDEMALPFGDAMKSKLATIADDQRVRALSHEKLPAVWTTVYELTQLDDEQFAEHRAEITPDLERSTVSGWRKKARRAAREIELAEKTLAAAGALGQKLYGVILADPPWRFEPYSRETGMDRAADNHYQTEGVDKIAALNIPAADDAVLFLWATVPMLVEAIDVMRAWGFTYKSNFAWVKHKAGTGYWNRNRHELLLVGTRGHIPAPAPGDQYESVIEARAGRHSAKPFAFHEIIEDMFPTVPRVELFARSRRAGWDAWGNEVTDDAA